MINPLQTNRRDAVSLKGVGTTGARTPEGAAAAAMGAIAARLATRLAAELALTEAEPWNGGSASDAYGVEATSAELATELGGTPADQGRLARALGDWAQEGAVLIAARPGSRALDALHAAFGAADAEGRGTPVDQAVATIEAAARRLTATPR